MSSTTIVRWDGDLRVASEVLTRGFAGYGVPQRETPEAVQRQVEAGCIDPARSFLALDSGVAIGGAFAAARPDGCARLHALVVDPGWRRRGLGRALLRAARNDLEAAGSWEVGTETLVDNHAAIALYTAEGFRTARRVVCLRGEPPAHARTGAETSLHAVRHLPAVVRPLHRDRVALRRMAGVRVALGERGGWIAWRDAVLLDLVAEEAEIDGLLAWLPREPCKIVDVPEGDPLLAALRSRGWTEYATQLEMQAWPGSSCGGDSTSPIVVHPLPPGGGAACERILRLLPRWFGIEGPIVGYRRDVEAMETWVACSGARIVGFITIRQHTECAAEVQVMAVREELHRRGVGGQLLAHAEGELRQKGVELLQVKTRGPSAPDPEYDRTRAFYRAQGFRPLEETMVVWGEEDPCLIMVKSLPATRSAPAGSATRPP